MKNFWQIEQEVRAAAVRSGKFVVLVPWGKGLKRACAEANRIDDFKNVVGVYSKDFAPNQVIEDLVEFFGEEREIKFSASRLYVCRPKEHRHGKDVLQAA